VIIVIGWKIGMRDAFSEELYEIAKKDSDLVLIMADTGAICHDLFKTKLSNQYINVGIAEQNMIGIATGLTLSGKKTFVYAISPFSTMRCYEQIRVDICCPNLPVTIVGVGAGFDYNTLGPTHHGTEDIGIMNLLPNMIIYSPSDSTLIRQVAREAYTNKNPSYIRIDRTGLPLIYNDYISQHDLDDGYTILRNGKDICIIATGRMSYRMQEIVKKLDATLIDLFRLKPLCEDLIWDLEEYSKIITVEEHFVNSGLGNIISEFLSGAGLQIPLLKIGIPNKFCRIYGSREDLLKYNKLDNKNILKRIEKFIC